MKNNAAVTASEANEIYDKLKEGVHLAGYTFVRVCSSLEWLLENGRWKTCGSEFDNKHRFLDSINLAEFRHTARTSVGVGRQREFKIALTKAASANPRGSGHSAPRSWATVGRSLSMAHAGYSPEQIAEQLRLTLMRNEQRRWPDWRTQSPDQAVEHVR